MVWLPMVNSVHDALFKATFSNVEHTAGELKLMLPPALAARIDFASLALCPGSFVDQSLAHYYSDLLFSVQIADRSGFVYVLFEHQSTVDRFMPFRLLEYMVRVWQQWLSDHPKARRLPAIVPLVVHHSKAGWRAAVAFEELLDLDSKVRAEIAPYLVRFRFLLDDLSAQSDEALRARAMTGIGRLSLWCLRHARDPDWLLDQLDRWDNVFSEVAHAPSGMAALATVFRYIWVVQGKLSHEELRALVERKLGKYVEEAVVTTAEQLWEEGRKAGLEKGLEKGLEDGQRRALLKLLGTRFGQLPEAAVARVKVASLEQIDVWLDRVLTAPTLTGVLGEK